MEPGEWSLPLLAQSSEKLVAMEGQPPLLALTLGFKVEMEERAQSPQT